LKSVKPLCHNAQVPENKIPEPRNPIFFLISQIFRPLKNGAKKSDLLDLTRISQCSKLWPDLNLQYFEILGGFQEPNWGGEKEVPTGSET
jgi:hypothetical protein